MSGELEKAILTNTVTEEDFAVLFNPSDYTIERTNTYASLAVPGLEAPILQFVAGANRTLQMELLLDSREAVGPGGGAPPIVPAGSDIREQVARITDLMKIQGETHAPPPLLFTWGSLTFTCVLTQVSQKYVLFLPSGVPIRAQLACKFSEFRNAELEARDVKRETADYTKRHVFRQGDTLPALAAREYGEPGLWRVIALANAIDTPRTVEIGAELRLPRLPYRDRLTSRLYE